MSVHGEQVGVTSCLYAQCTCQMGMVKKAFASKRPDFPLLFDLLLLVQVISQGDKSLNSPQSREQNQSL